MGSRIFRHKTIRRCLIALIAITSVLILNGLAYLCVFQYKTVEKIRHHENINLYEKISIMTLHAGLWTVGNLYCPDAAYANFKMLTKNDTVYLHSNNWLSPKITKRFNSNRLGKMAWNGNSDYAYDSKEKNAAVLLNYCYLKEGKINGKPCYIAICEYTWKQPSKTRFKIGPCSITIHEELFYELEKINLLHPYTLICYYEK